MMVNPGRLRALVVDDNIHARAIGVLSLRKLGIGPVEEAGDGAEALLRLMSDPFGLVLMDWYMPDINGAGLLRVLRDPRFGPAYRTPVILMTGYPSDANMAQARSLGISEILPKPFSVDHLSAALGRVLTSPRSGGTVAYV